MLLGTDTFGALFTVIGVFKLNYLITYLLHPLHLGCKHATIQLTLGTTMHAINVAVNRDMRAASISLVW